VPAPIASTILAEQTAAERALLSTPYASTVVVTLACSQNWSRKVHAFRDVYGCLIPRFERKIVGAIGIEGNKCAEHTNAGELLNIMTESRQLPALMDRSDDEILDLVLADLESLFPRISSCVSFQKVLRWPCAQTLSPIGRSKAIERYRREIQSSMPLCLAGDFMGIGSTDSAAQTGIWAATAVRATDLENDA
jgi:oxygen-dependent protoporphyrinogen oxidase